MTWRNIQVNRIPRDNKRPADAHRRGGESDIGMDRPAGLPWQDVRYSPIDESPGIALSTWKPVRLEHASRLINHGPTVLVTSAVGSVRNVMAAAWSMPVEFTPPRVAVVIDKKTHTWDLVHESGAFALCIPGRALADLVWTVGNVSGRDGDKFERYGIAAGWSPNLRVPVIETGCCAWMECRLIPEHHTEQAYDTCFAEVLAAAADARIFDDGRWDFRDDNRDLHTLHHLGAGQFAVAGDPVRGRFAD